AFATPVMNTDASLKSEFAAEVCPATARSRAAKWSEAPNSEWILADAAQTGLATTAHNAAPAAVNGVETKVGAGTKAKHKSRRADHITAGSVVAGRGRIGADVATRAAVGGVGGHVNAGTAALRLPRSAVTARPIDAVSITDPSTGAAIGGIGGQVNT